MRIRIIDDNEERRHQLQSQLRLAGWLCPDDDMAESLATQLSMIPFAVVNMNSNPSLLTECPVIDCRDDVKDGNLTSEQVLELVQSKIHATSYQISYPLTANLTVKKMAFIAKKSARSQAPILISGETGTGKELMANYIHCHSHHAGGPFVAVNCAAIPDTMLEAILFGYEKGAFTNATQTYIGKFEQADNGTLFLDEIGEMPIDLQAKLLRVLQNSEVDRIGSKAPKRVNIRIICATNKDLAAEVSKGAFRSDLFYRIFVMNIRCLPLRERVEDIELLAHYFTELYAEQLGRECRMSDPCLSLLKTYNWPGNIRELQNVIQRAVIMDENNVIESDDLDITKVHHLQELDLASSDFSLQANEIDTIVKVLRQTNGRRLDAARLLMISPRTLRYKISKLKECGIDIP